MTAAPDTSRIREALEAYAYLAGEVESPADLICAADAKAELAVVEAALTEAERHREALEVIAAPDDLVVANPDAFSIHAFRRAQETAKWALAGSGGDTE